MLRPNQIVIILFCIVALGCQPTKQKDDSIAPVECSRIDSAAAVFEQCKTEQLIQLLAGDIAEAQEAKSTFIDDATFATTWKNRVEIWLKILDEISDRGKEDRRLLVVKERAVNMRGEVAALLENRFNREDILPELDGHIESINTALAAAQAQDS